MADTQAVGFQLRSTVVCAAVTSAAELVRSGSLCGESRTRTMGRPSACRLYSLSTDWLGRELQNEQFSIIQPQYDYLSTFWFSGLPTPFTNQIHPYHRSFIEEEPKGDILQAASRWDWITHPQGMWENWVACGADERNRLLQLPFDQICNGNFGIPGRPDLLPPGGP